MDVQVTTYEADVPASDADAMPAFTHRQILQVIFGILLCILLSAIDQTVVVPAVPAIAADLNGFNHLAWIVSGYLLTSTAATPLYGKLSDMYGRRALLLPAIVLFVVASILCALAQSLTELIAFRAIQGIGGGGLMAMAQAAIADVVAPRERGKYQGYMAGTWGMASIFGPILGGWMTDALSWRWIFWINVPIGIAAFLLSNRALRLLRPRAIRTRIDYVGAALLTGFITACLLLLSWGGVEFPWLSSPMLGLGSLALVLLAGLAWQERRIAEPLLPPRLFHNAVFSRGVAIASLATAVMLAGVFLLPLDFQLLRGANAAMAGTMLVPYLLTNTVGAYVSGQIARRTGRAKGIVLAGLIGATVGFVMLAYAAAAGGVAEAVAMAVVGFGIGVCMPGSLVIVQNTAERRDLGTATGTLLFLRSMGGAFGSTVAGAILVGQFGAGMAARGLAGVVDLASLRGGDGGGMAALAPAVRQAASAALASGFRLAFLGCAVLAAIAAVICAGMRDVTLRSGPTG